MKLLPLPCS